MSKNIREVGDDEFPLWINVSKDIKRKHPLVGKVAYMNDKGQEVFSSMHGTRVKISGVIIQNSQIAGLEVKYKGRTYWGPIKDFYTEGGEQISEDIYLYSQESMDIRGLLDHWSTQHDYYGTEWDGIEKIHFQLGILVQELAVEAAGWYKYPSSTR